MEYRVEEVARAAGVSVDTVRFYQSRGLLPPPQRRGRVAFYSDAHLERLRRIRELNRGGLTLEGVGRALRAAEKGDDIRTSLLGALSEVEGDQTFTRAELAQRTGIPAVLLASIEEAGLLLPLEDDGEPRYTQSDLESVEAGLGLLESGLPLHELLPLAREHAAHVERIAERAIELFDRHVRRTDTDDPPATREVTEAFRKLLPAVTTLVALHFQRTLIHRARRRLEASGDREGLAAALAATERARLQVSWR